MEVSTTKVAAHCRCDFIAVFYAVEAKFWKSLPLYLPYTLLLHCKKHRTFTYVLRRKSYKSSGQLSRRRTDGTFSWVGRLLMKIKNKERRKIHNDRRTDEISAERIIMNQSLNICFSVQGDYVLLER